LGLTSNTLIVGVSFSRNFGKGGVLINLPFSSTAASFKFQWF